MTKSVSVLASVLLFTCLSVSHAEIASVSVRVDGLACPFCVHGVEKKLEAVEGVGGVTVDLADGRADLLLEGDVLPPPGQIGLAVKKAGFTARSIDITAVGSITADGERLWLRVRFGPERFLLIPHASEGGSRLARLRDLASGGTPVAVSGSVHQHADGPLGLVVTDVQEVHELVFRVRGLDCDKCAERLAIALGKVPGVYRAVINHAAARATVESLGTAVDAEAIRHAIVAAGFEVADDDGER